MNPVEGYKPTLQPVQHYINSNSYTFQQMLGVCDTSRILSDCTGRHVGSEQ